MCCFPIGYSGYSFPEVSFPGMSPPVWWVRMTVPCGSYYCRGRAVGGGVCQLGAVCGQDGLKCEKDTLSLHRLSALLPARLSFPWAK